MSPRPNVLLVMTDQHRGDCIGADPNALSTGDGVEVPHTPNIDHLAARGTLFSRHYSPSPSSIPARRCLLTGQTPATNGCPGWGTNPWDFERTLPGELTRAGYQTRLVGKIHSIPNRNHCGFEHLVQHEGLHHFPDDDYSRWLDERIDDAGHELAHGLGRNSWDPRPWHLPESYHPTRWTTERALDFLDTRDSTRPFFLNLSYVRPHTPFDPPESYYEMYASEGPTIPLPAAGEWSDDLYAGYVEDNPAPDAWCADLPAHVIRRARACYLGLITQIDHQLKRVFDKLKIEDEWENTLVVFTSDHGEMLGDHHLWRKTYAYEGSARVPLVIRPPEGTATDRGTVDDSPVGLHDLFPTILDLVDVAVPDTVEGRSLRPLVEGSDVEWRRFYHGEHAPIYVAENATQFLVNGTTKYVWNPVTGDELLFDLERDPAETVDRSEDSDYTERLTSMRTALVDRLDGREEGFVENGTLQPTSLPLADA